MERQFDAVVFDVFGTLLDVTSVEAACAEVTAEAAAFSVLWRQKQLEYTWLRTLMDRYEDFWSVTGAALDHTLERFGCTTTADQRARLLNSWLALEPFPEVAGALEEMHPWALAVLSNGTAEMLVQGLEHAKLLDRLSPVLSVDEVRRFKPHPDVYALAEDRLSLSRDRILFVSSNAWDVAGALSFGLHVAWVNRAGLPAERLGPAPDLVVSDLGELAAHGGWR
jgi:2-haloacid dehalogenase